ncbi:MAG TPA: hypothetical protein VMB49_04920 [Acidobacteriaceae bacterium]|nr:hypothetical protein [Acidobacteriaceae bacterium]
MKLSARLWALRLVCLVLTFAAFHPAPAQDADAIANQKKAKATLDAMVAALGGQRWLTLASSMGQGRTAGFYQGKPTGATADFYEFQKFPDQTRIEIGKKRNVVEIISGNDAWEITYKGKRELPKDQVQELLRRRDHSIRTVITTWLNDPKTVLIYGGQSLVERHLADQVTLINSENDSVTIQTDAETHLPLRRSYQWRDPLYKDKNTDAEEYDDYHTVDGLPTPFSTTRFHNGDMTNQRFLYRAAYNIPLTPDMFNPDQTAAKIKK